MSRHNRSLKDDEEVLGLLEDAGIDRERVMVSTIRRSTKHSK